MSEQSQSKVIRDKAFAKRLEVATESHPHAPSGHGRQVWLRVQLEEQTHTKVSPEAVRKWFAGEARPRPNFMSNIAQVLEVDEAWLSLGSNPSNTPKEQAKINATVNGAVNMVAGQIQLFGGTIAFPEEGSEFDMFAIIKGKHIGLSVRLGERGGDFRISVPVENSTIVLVVPTNRPTVFEFRLVPREAVERFGKSRGGYVDLDVERDEAGFVIGDTVLPEVRSFGELVA